MPLEHRTLPLAPGRMLNTARACIDLSALRNNLSVVSSLCPTSRVLAIVKANAYGHGLLPVVRALENADGFGVARLEEALSLRSAGIASRIVVLGTLLDAADLATCAEHGIDVTVHDLASVKLIASQAESCTLRVWLKLDSGLHRVGLAPEAFIAASRLLSGRVRELIHTTHFSSADRFSTDVLDRQLACFWACHRAAAPALVSVANSAALIGQPQTRADWVRAGIMLYGDNPLAARATLPLRAAMTLEARVIAVREIGPGESVGYNERWLSRRSSLIATVGIGYGDGYPRQAPDGTPVAINGRCFPLVGQVSMDSITVDVTDDSRIAAGDRAILWGPDLPAAVIAEHASTITNDLFASLQQRVTRVVLE